LTESIGTPPGEIRVTAALTVQPFRDHAQIRTPHTQEPRDHAQIRTPTEFRVIMLATPP
jgi:hypothetical protein